jgi:hypothetical protein
MTDYIDAALARFGMTDCNTCPTPAAPGTKLEKTQPGDELADDFPFIEAVGVLLWIARVCRPEIIYAVNQLGAHSKNPNKTHITACKRVFRYLKGTRNNGITFSQQDHITLSAYSDSDFDNEPELNDLPMRSITGTLIYLKGVGPLYWQSSLQSTVSRSTAEAEYRAGGDTGTKVKGMRNILGEVGFPQPTATDIFEDNEACIAMTKTIVCSSKSRHIKMEHHYIRELVKDKEVHLKSCDTKEMIADIFTKALDLIQFRYLCSLLFGRLFV